MLINDEIREKEVRLIDSDGAQLGILALADAKAKAEAKGLDLVLQLRHRCIHYGIGDLAGGFAAGAEGKGQ